MALNITDTLYSIDFKISVNVICSKNPLNMSVSSVN